MKHIKEFDGLRGLLALWVFVAHVVETGPYWSATRHVHANWAVDIFFILSGFVIFHLLSRGEDYRSFITRRCFRLFPAFAVCFLFALGLYGALRINDQVAFAIAPDAKLMPYLVSHAAMLHGAVPNEMLPYSATAILPPAWSVSVEWQFYLLAPLLFLFATRRTILAAVVVATLVGLRVLHDVGQLGILWPGGPRNLTFDTNAFLPLKLEFFAIGGACSALWQWLHRCGSAPVPRWCFGLLAAGAVVAGLKSPAISMWLIVFAVVVHAHFQGGVWFTRQSCAILNARPTQFLGRISYSLYLLHLPVIILARHWITNAFPNLAAPQLQALLVLGALFLSVMGAWFLNVVIEQPMIDLGKRLTRKSRPILASSAAAPIVTSA